MGHETTEPKTVWDEDTAFKYLLKDIGKLPDEVIKWYKEQDFGNIITFITMGIDIADEIMYDKDGETITLKKPDKINLNWVYRFACRILGEYGDSPDVWRQQRITTKEFHAFI